MLLAIDTSTRYAGVALADDQRVIAARTWYSTANHTTELMPAVAQLLQSRATAVKDLEGVAVALGPGGFSALRVGVSVAKGLAAAGGLKIVGVGSLDLEAFPYAGSGLPVCALLEAGRGEAASALFSPEGIRIREDRVSTAEELTADIDQTVSEPTLFCGEGVAGWSEEIKAALGPRAVVCSLAPALRVWSLALIARQRLEAGLVDDLTTLQPNYLRLPSIGQPKLRDRGTQASRRRGNAGDSGTGRNHGPS